MATAAKTILLGAETADSDVPSDALAMLMHQAGTARREAARSILEPVVGTEAWQQLKNSVERELTSYAAASIELLHPRLLMIAEATLRMLPGEEARAAYRAAFKALEDDAERWCTFAHIRYVAPCVHRAMAWDAVCFLGKAGLSVRQIAVVVTGREFVRETQQVRGPAPAASRAQKTATPVARPAHSLADLLHNFLMARREAQAQEQAAIAERVAMNRAERREPPLTVQSAMPSPARIAALEDYTIEQSIPLDALALHRSIFGTWVRLVGLSWISLLWCSFLSIFTGVFIGGAALWGCFMVPAWATFWGFVGMGHAKDSTLASMSFQAVDPNSDLGRSAARLAQALNLPTPHIGTIPVANAFAMGRDFKDATVAIGNPLLERLSARQVDAVIGHELGHIVSGDMRRKMLMRTFQNATVFYAGAAGLKQKVRYLLCLFAELHIHAFSREREYWADAIGAALTSKQAMIGALKALDGLPAVSARENAHAHFMFHTPASKWFSTHPPLAARIEALEAETYIRQLPRVRA